jgi:E3 ubiquitin-protein ligase RNF115/126
MADHPPSSPGGRLDASGPREVVYCHQCDHEWYQDEHGLVCPNCDGEITEIVRISRNDIISFERMLTSLQITPESDPRPIVEPPPSPPHGFRDLHDHNPWDGDADSDPEEADIEEHITHGPGGSVLFSRTIRTSTPGGPFRNRRRRDPMPDDLDPTMRNFQEMIGSLMGPGFRPGQAGRSGPDTLFTQGPFGGTGFRIGGNGPGPALVGGRFTFTSTGGAGGRLRPRDADGPQPGGPQVDDLATYASPPIPSPLDGRSAYFVSIRAPPDHLARIIGSLFGPMRPPGHQHPGDPPVGGMGGMGGMPPGLQGLFAAMLNPANARSGDAVYSQEALDQIISTLMEQHPTSNAPGPASPDAIAALPKKKLDEKMLGPEGKGECSVCMDDVTFGVEVVQLPCSHWFHETCAGAWLSEHNTCPICRKGIEGESPSQTPPPNSRRSSQSGPASRNEHRARRLSAVRPRMGRDSTSNSRNEARLESIRNNGRLTPTEETRPRWRSETQLPGNGDYAGPMPGSFPSVRRPSEMSENQRDSRRGNTSGSDQSRGSRRSSQSGGGGGNGGNGGNGGGGPMGWLRDHFGSNRRQN